MDKYEYKVRSEEISKLIEKEKYVEAVKIADTIDWRRVKSPTMLLKIAALYRISRRNEDSREMLMLAYERYPTNRSVVYSLCELSIELDDVVAAIEYYKQFAKLAPKDNGVYTLRYRILEAQEASLEERIEILEELKKKDYQEEWAYELAYLYHRVGLSTKCVEECDDIILWFGDGPYVMKAMELKAKHVPLTEIQQQNYEIMLGNAGQNYSSGNYGAENYDAGDYGADGYDEQNYSNEGYGEQNYSNEGYDGQNYGNEGYDGQNYYNEGYDEQDYGLENYDGQNYDAEDYDAQNYGTENYDTSNYDTQGYDAGNYDGQDYGQGSYDNVNDSDGSYENETYGQYADDTYTQNNYVDDGYGNLSYVDGSYQDNGYTSEFYVEQTYDENGNLINPEMYVDDNYSQDNYAYPQEEYPQDTGYTRQTGAPKEYRNGLHVVEPATPPAGNSGDMSQYNTINLQKVVAESMKELFPDDNDDVFAEDRAKYNSGELIRDTSGDTRIFTSVRESSTGSQTQTGRVNVAQMVTGVSEAAPEPHTGAIKKVLVPGDDARSIKSDSNMEELRDTTEKTVDDEHTRMEHNDENVYHEQSLIDENTTDEMQQTQTGSMKLDDVLVKWERMKQDNAKQNQENIKKRVHTQTGKIFADFDNSIKSGILGELERDEAEAERRNQESSIERSSNKKSNDGFLDADVTGDIPQKQASDEDFDVEYVTDNNKPAKLQESSEPEDSVEAVESEPTEEQPAKSEESIEPMESIEDEEATEYAEELDEEAADYGTDSYVQETSEVVRNIDDEIDVHAQEGDQEDAVGYESSVYTQKIPIEGVENYDTESDSTTEAADAKKTSLNAYVEDSNEYTEELYAEDVDEYTAGAYVEDIDEYNENVYTEASDGYNEDTYAEAAGEYTEEIYAEDEQEYTSGENTDEYVDGFYEEDTYDDLEDAYSDTSDHSRYVERPQSDRYHEEDLDPEDVEGIAEMAREDALKTQEIKMNTADLSSLSEKIVATTKKEASGAKREEIRDFTPEEQTLFENFAVTKKIKKQIIYALENMTLAAYTGNVIITGDAGLDTVRMAKNLVKEYQASDESFSGKLAKITGEKINQRNIKDVFEKLNNGGIIIEKANGMSEEKLYELAINLNQDTLGIVVIMEDTKKEITKLLEKQAMIVDYFNIRIDLMEMDNNALVAYAKNYALALEYSIDELGTLALYTRIANMQSGNHVVTKDEVRDIIDEAIWKSKKSKIKNFVDVLFARRYDNEDMIVLKERDFM